MGQPAVQLSGFRAKLDYAGRQFHAWWEGYEFDRSAERTLIAAKYGKIDFSLPVDDLMVEAIWGGGRHEPGSPAWTMRFARLLSLPLKANINVFGAGRGAVLDDIKKGTRWKAHGFSRAQGVARKNLFTYESVSDRVTARPAQGAICFFEIGADQNPAVLAATVAQSIKPGSIVVFVDYVATRRGARLRGCFPDRPNYGVRSDGEFESLLREAGFSSINKTDETTAFMEQIAVGWSGWRRSYQAIMQMEDAARRAQFMHAMARNAELWAERYDALKSGQLRVASFRAVRNS